MKELDRIVYLVSTLAFVLPLLGFTTAKPINNTKMAHNIPYRRPGKNHEDNMTWTEITGVDDSNETNVEDNYEFSSIDNYENRVEDSNETGFKNNNESVFKDDNENNIKDENETINNNETSAKNNNETSVENNIEDSAESKSKNSVEYNNDNSVKDNNETSVKNNSETSLQNITTTSPSSLNTSRRSKKHVNAALSSNSQQHSLRDGTLTSLNQSETNSTLANIRNFFTSKLFLSALFGTVLLLTIVISAVLCIYEKCYPHNPSGERSSYKYHAIPMEGDDVGRNNTDQCRNDGCHPTNESDTESNRSKTPTSTIDTQSNRSNAKSTIRSDPERQPLLNSSIGRTSPSNNQSSRSYSMEDVFCTNENKPDFHSICRNFSPYPIHDLSPADGNNEMLKRLVNSQDADDSGSEESYEKLRRKLLTSREQRLDGMILGKDHKKIMSDERSMSTVKSIPEHTMEKCNCGLESNCGFCLAEKNSVESPGSDIADGDHTITQDIIDEGFMDQDPIKTSLAEQCMSSVRSVTEKDYIPGSKNGPFVSRIPKRTTVQPPGLKIADDTHKRTKYIDQTAVGENSKGSLITKIRTVKTILVRRFRPELKKTKTVKYRHKNAK